MTTPTRPCELTRTPARPAATSTLPMTLLPGRTSPSQLAALATQGKSPAASASPCEATRTPSRPAATSPLPRTLLPGRTSPSQVVTPARQGKPPAASARPTAVLPPPSPENIQKTGTVPRQQLTATIAATAMPEIQGAVAKMRERMAQMSSSFGEESKGTKTQKEKNAFANLIAKFEVEPSPLKQPKPQNFLSQCAQQPVRLPIAISSYHEQTVPSPHASTASHSQNEREIQDSLLAAQKSTAEQQK